MTYANSFKIDLSLDLVVQTMIIRNLVWIKVDL